MKLRPGYYTNNLTNNLYILYPNGECDIWSDTNNTFLFLGYKICKKLYVDFPEFEVFLGDL